MISFNNHEPVQGWLFVILYDPQSDRLVEAGLIIYIYIVAQNWYFGIFYLWSTIQDSTRVPLYSMMSFKKYIHHPTPKPVISGHCKALIHPCTSQMSRVAHTMQTSFACQLSSCEHHILYHSHTHTHTHTLWQRVWTGTCYGSQQFVNDSCLLVTMPVFVPPLDLKG